MFVSCKALVLYCAWTVALLTVCNATETTLMNYIVTHQIETNEDFVQIGLQLLASDPSLKLAIQEGEALVQQIKRKAEDYCNKYKTGKQKCKETVDVGKFEVEPVYRVIKEEPKFQNFVVKHEMTVGITNVEKMGHFVDQILKHAEKVKLVSFDWRPISESKQQDEALDTGLQEGKNMCSQVGEELDRIISIRQIVDFDNSIEDEELEAAEAEEEENSDSEVIQFKFQVECRPKK